MSIASSVSPQGGGVSAVVRIPRIFRRFAKQSEEVAVRANSVDEALRRLVEEHPGLAAQLFASDGSLRGFVGVFLNARNIRDLTSEEKRLTGGEEITLMPSFSGG